jgi:HK97 family phage major capsid protein
VANQINRMSEREIFDLNDIDQPIFTSAFHPEAQRAEVTDRARRAVEIANFPHQRADTPATQERLEGLLLHGDSADKELAKRILTTGGPVYRSAFTKYVSGKPLDYGEERAMALGAGATGGFQVVYTLDPTIIPTSNLSVNPYRSICRVETIVGTNEWRGVTSTGVTATYGTEGAEQTDGSPALLQPSAITQMASTFIPFSIQYGQDVGDPSITMAHLIQDAKDDLEATQFTTGLGTGVYPQGLLVGATTTTSTASGGAFVIGDTYKLENALGPRFRPRASLVGNRTIFNLIRAFDTAGGAGMFIGYPNPLQGGMQNNVPQSGRLGVNLLAYASYECSAMTAAITGGSLIP